ncbi:prolyl oligopeptidase family serine peptidase [Sphingomonas sp. ZB1N12]|uniref:S9 family peptidase n=1 Tax=Sphingomonas arabinosi TaxID=3096160 RepID=UPI002FCA5D2D
MRTGQGARYGAKLSFALAAAVGSVLPADGQTVSGNGSPMSFPMNDEVRTQVRGLRGLSLSPDGKQVLTGITDTTADGGRPHLWLLQDKRSPRQLTFSASTDRGGETAGQFSPDGSAVYFIAHREGTKSLFRLPLGGGEPERLQIARDAAGQVTSHWQGKAIDGALSVAGYAFSPDGKYLALWAADPESAAVKVRKARKDDGYSHGEDDHRTHLFLIDPASAVARDVKIDGAFDSLGWSFDSADMLVTTDPDHDEVGPDATVWRVDPQTLGATRIDLPRTVRDPAFLPGRQRIVYADTCEDDAPSGCVDLFVRDVAGGTPRNLTRGFDGALSNDFTILPDGDLIMTIARHMRSRPARMSTRTGAVTWLDADQPIVGTLVANARQTAWAMTTSGPTLPMAVAVTPKPGGKATPLAIPALVPARWPKVQSKIVHWQNEGLTIEAALYMPTVAPGTRVPLVVSIHGGPAGRFADDYNNLVQMLVAEGWAVLQPNIRGSTGYGAKFLAANKNDLGGADYRDIMTGVDAMLKEHPLDPDRMALIGYSYGGEMAGFVVGKTDRFKAIVSGAPVIDQFSEYGTENGTYYDRWYYGKPWLNFADVWRQSPLSTAGNAKTPFLLLQGSEDVTDPLGQSLEMWRALKQSGAPVALAVYPREGHGETGGNFRALASQEPWHGVDLRRRMFGFLRAAFAGEPDPLAIARKDVP